MKFDPHDASNAFEDVFYIEGLFFLKTATIEDNSPLATHALADIMKHICYN
jgi:hypothetical protein